MMQPIPKKITKSSGTRAGLLILFLLTLPLSGCGFAFRGSAANAIAVHTPSSAPALLFNDARSGENANQTAALQNALARAFAEHGLVADDTMGAITVHNIQLFRYELLGVLTEIRFVLTADVSYPVTTPTDRQVAQRIRATHSYQFNEAAPAATDRAAGITQAWLYDDLARQITEQWLLLSNKN